MKKLIVLLAVVLTGCASTKMTVAETDAWNKREVQRGSIAQDYKSLGASLSSF